MSRPRIEIHPNEKHGRLTFVRELQQSGYDRRIECLCDCGKVWIGRLSDWRQGRTKSCGCWRHGLSKNPEYQNWSAMRTRCRNPKHEAYKHYGGRGIRICERWESFETFLTDMGTRPSYKHSLERIDSNGPYSPENCIWELSHPQNQNRRNSRIWVIDGVEYESSPVAAKALGVSKKTIQNWCRGKSTKTNCTSYLKYPQQ